MPLLAAGAGASEGLDTILARLMAEEKLAQESKKVDEESRHNKATEANTAESIRELGRYRTDALDEKVRGTIRQQAMERPIGAPVTEEEYGEETGKGGVPGGVYKITPGAKVSALSGFSTAPGSVSSLTGQGEPRAPINGKTTITEDQTSPMNAPRSITNAGTEAQQVARLKEQNTGVNSQNETVAITDKGLADAIGLKVGDPIDVNREPRTQRKMFRGQDVTDKVGHWEKPPAPLFGTIQTGEVYNRLDRRSGVASPLPGLDGNPLPLATPTAIRTREDLANRVASHFDDIQKMLDDAEGMGALGPIRGRLFTDFLAGRVGSTGDAAKDELLGELRQNLSLARSGLAQLHGRGGANVGIVENLEKNQDAGFMDYNELKGSLRAMKTWVDKYAQKPKTGATPAPASDPNNPLGLTFR